ncbi:hypothetical protein AGMMS50262_14050 [Bacteroidia bacterium]|nr:hypothetical protein AGMMS50262_14050 [Bacteroidia bacterium]
MNLENRHSSNVLLLDKREKEEEFVAGLEKATGEPWLVKSYVSNEGQTRLDNILRYVKYFYYPFLIFLNRKKYTRIVAWQQFYGLLLAFYCRLFRVKKSFSLIVMTFIYKPKAGIAGRIYAQFMQYAVNSCYIDKIIVHSGREKSDYAGLFPEVSSRFVFVPLGIDKIVLPENNPELKDENYLLATGRSNRDYNFLVEALKNTPFRLKIISNTYSHSSLPPNIELYDRIFEPEMYDYMNHCYAVIVPLKQPGISSGQLVVLQAMQLGKPVIVTKSEALSDYVINGQNGLIVEKEKKVLLNAIQQLYNDRKLYDTLVENGKFLYNKKHTTGQLAIHVANYL